MDTFVCYNTLLYIATFTNEFDEVETCQFEDEETESVSPVITNTEAGTQETTTVRPNTNIKNTKKSVAPKRILTETKSEPIDQEKLLFLKTINQRMEAKDKKQKIEDAEDRYAVNIADKLPNLPHRERLMAKHEIDNILFKHEMQVLDKENSNNNLSFDGNWSHYHQYQNNLGNQNQTGQYINFLNNQQMNHLGGPQMSNLANQQQQRVNITTNHENAYQNQMSPSFQTTPVSSSPSYPPQ